MTATRSALAAVIAFGAVPRALPAQAARYVPIDHWTYEYIGRLRDRGALTSLHPLAQPYRRIDIARGLGAIDPDTLTGPVAEWVRRLRGEFEGDLQRLVTDASARGGAYAVGGGQALTSRRRDPLRPLGDGDGWPRYRAGAWIETGPLVAEARVFGDLYLDGAPNGRGDPDGGDPGIRRGGHSDHAYLSVQAPFGSITLGRLRRNWSWLGTEGLMISDVPTSYPQVGFEISGGRFTLRSFTGELDVIGSNKRYLAAHRLDYVTDDLAISLGEAILYARDRGGVLLRFFNPTEALFFDHDSPPRDGVQNLMLDGQLWARWRGMVFFVEGMLDDFDLLKSGPDAEPSLYAFTLAWRKPDALRRADLFAEYQQVAAWTYRTPNGIDGYTFLSRGLGPNFSDYARATLAADLYPPIAGLRLSPALIWLRQGEGDFRDPVPPAAQYLASRSLFLGVKETTYRVALRGWWQPHRWFWLKWDIGQNVIRNRGHVPGDNGSQFEAAIEAEVRIDVPVR